MSTTFLRRNKKKCYVATPSSLELWVNVTNSTAAQGFDGITDSAT